MPLVNLQWVKWVYEWNKHLQENCKDDDDKHPRCPSASRTDDNTGPQSEKLLMMLAYWLGHVIKFVQNNSWLLHDDNAPAHTSLIFSEFFTKTTLMIPQPVDLPDIASCDFFLKLKRTMKGWHFAIINEINTVSLKELKKPYQKMRIKSPSKTNKHWHKCIISDYFEGDNIDVDG